MELYAQLVYSTVRMHHFHDFVLFQFLELKPERFAREIRPLSEFQTFEFRATLGVVHTGMP